MSTWAHSIAIAAYVREQGARYSGDILAPFYIGESTLRRRRPELERLGIVFVQRGRGSFYVTAELAEELPSTYPALALKTARQQAALASHEDTVMSAPPASVTAGAGSGRWR